MCWAQLLCGMRSGSSLQGAAGWCSRVVVSQKFNPFFAFVLSQHRCVQVPAPPVLVSKGFHPKEWVVMGRSQSVVGEVKECRDKLLPVVMRTTNSFSNTSAVELGYGMRLVEKTQILPFVDG